MASRVHRRDAAGRVTVPPHRTTVVTVAATKGGGGKSALAYALATTCARAGDRVTALDADAYQRTLAVTLMGWRQTHPAHADALELHVVDAPTLPPLRDAVEDARRAAGHAWIVVDTPGMDTPTLRTAILAADLVVVPVRPTPADVWALDHLATLWETWPADQRRPPVGVVLVQVPTATRLLEEVLPMIEAVCKQHDWHRLTATITARVAWVRATAYGTDLGDESPAAGREWDAVWTELRGLLG